jgi:hypothetical protein
MKILFETLENTYPNGGINPIRQRKKGGVIGLEEVYIE